MGKNQSASNLTNIIKQDANGNITFVSGSTTLMSVSSSGAITTTGNVAGTASYASNAELFDGLDSTVFTLTSSFTAQTASFTAFTSSVNTFTSSLNSFSASILTFTASQNILNGTYATTGSNTFAGIQTVNSNLIVTGSITAQTLVVQTITSSVVYSSGSNVFGNDIANTQTFTGSVLITGSLSGTSATFSGNVISTLGFLQTANNYGIEGRNAANTAYRTVLKLNASNQIEIGRDSDISSIILGTASATNALTIISTGNVGIGTSSPNIGGYGANGRLLTIQGVSGSYGVLELTSNSANADGSAIGRLDFGSDGQAANYKAISSIASFLSGSTSTKFGADLRFYTRADNAASGDPTERMRIENAYSLRFTSNNASAATFDLNYRFSSPDSARIRFATTTDFNQNEPGQISFWTRASDSQGGGSITERMRITSAGNVGIGTSPASGVALDIRNNSTTTLADFRNANSGGYGIYIAAGSTSSQYVQRWADYANNTLMTINGAGNVGIGTTTINDKFVVSALANTWAGVFYNGTTANQSFGIQILAGTSATDTAFRVLNGAQDTTYFRITGAGNVGIGTASPSSLLQVGSVGNSTVRLGTSSTTNTSATYAFGAWNSSGSDMLTVRGDGLITFPFVISSWTTGNAANAWLNPSTGDLYRSTSSIKYKQNIQNYTKGLAEVMQLRPVSYEGKHEVDAGKTFAGLIAEDIHDLGLTEFVQYAEDGSPDALSYGNMVSLLTKAIQELNTKLDAANVEIEALKAK